MSLTWIEPSVAWLGEPCAPCVGVGVIEKYVPKIGYMALNKGTDEITKGLLAEKGGSGGAVQAYAIQAGTQAGGALCSPYGAVASSLCSKVGGVIGGVIAGMFSSVPEEWQTPEIWNKYTVPAIRAGQQGIATIRAYLTARDQLLDDVADALSKVQSRETSYAWANQWLIDHGLPAAPIDPRWEPRQDLWDAFKQYAIWAENPTTWPPTSPHDAGKKTSSYTSIQSNGTGGECVLAKKLAQPCSGILIAMQYPGGIPSPPGTGINWGMVGAFQIASTPTVSGQYAVFIPNMGAKNKATCVVAPQVVSQYQAQCANSMLVADVIPSQIGTTYALNLQELSAELLALAKQTKTPTGPPIVTGGAPRRGGAGPTPIIVIGGLAAAAAALAYFFL